MGKKKYYAYFVNGKKGITDNWPDCQKLVSGINSAKYKSFESLEAAQMWLDAGASYSLKNMAVAPGIYFDSGTGAGNGVEINVTDRMGKSFVRKFLDKGVTNNFGELTALKYALEIAEKENVKKIYGDSKLVIEYWSKGYIKKEVGEETVKLANEVKLLRKQFENSGGCIIHISGGSNPADLGFHRN